jgi:hypothetical protein
MDWLRDSSGNDGWKRNIAVVVIIKTVLRVLLQDHDMLVRDHDCIRITLLYSVVSKDLEFGYHPTYCIDLKMARRTKHPKPFCDHYALVDCIHIGKEVMKQCIESERPHEVVSV